ncbi:hypothetical protein [Clostridium ihumii]|uniref:hypothetical protein n=1 Tax=Clostridium ihumii TaxID=1470356 RepID=UPI000A64A937|nr:hypothetical protein [Clostridium ihumii]
MKKLFTEEDLKHAFDLGKQQAILDSKSNQNNARQNEFSSEISSKNENKDSQDLF